MSKKALTENEKQIMDLLWANNEPLTSLDILELTKEREWKHSYVISSLKSMMGKGLVEVCGKVKNVTQHVRQFKPILTREEYAARQALACGIDRKAIADVAVAMVKETYSDDEIYEMLNGLIQELEKREEEEQKKETNNV